MSMYSHNSHRLVWQLAWKDLRHEWILSICLIMAVAAVVSPLLILFGLKFGSIQILTNRLIDDPRNSEIRPVNTRTFEQSWFAAVAERPDVGFVIPMTRKISTSVEACVAASRTTSCKTKPAMDLMPTDDRDPLLLQNSAVIPAENECVLTRRAAERLKAAPGDELLVQIRRIVANRYEKVSLHLKVVSVLSDRAGSNMVMYVRLPVLEAVEKYKDGAAVSRYGWPGKRREAYPLYDGVLIHLAEPLSKVEELKLVNNSGFNSIQLLSPEELSRLAGLSIRRPGVTYMIRVKHTPVGDSAVATVKQRLRGKNATLLPWVMPLQAQLIDTQGQKITTMLFASLYQEKYLQSLDMDTIPMVLGRLAHSEAMPENKQQAVTLQLDQEGRTLRLPLILTGEEERDAVRIAPELAGIFRLLSNREVIYDEGEEVFLLSRKGYGGFRLYASSIDKVEGLRRYFEDQGIEVTTQADRIRDVQELSRYLSLIFWLIALTGAIGGIATLAASLYGSVERKRRDIAVLRLIGMKRTTLLRLPIYQGILLNAGGLALAIAVFFAISSVVNRLFSSKLAAGESLCTLSAGHIGSLIMLVLGIGVLAALVAALRITNLEPVEALRDE